MNSSASADSALRIIVTGLVAQFPLGGVAWDYLQYAEGLARLGHDVYYVEDTGQWPYNPLEGGISRSADYNVDYLRRAAARFGLTDRWAYRFPWKSQWFGNTAAGVDELIATADLVINVSGTLENPDRYGDRARLIYIDSDPVFTQVKLAKGVEPFTKLIDSHDVTFSFGERMSPELAGDRRWLPTRQPILLDEWSNSAPHNGKYTTVMNWTSYKPVEFAGRRFGQKDQELRRFIDLPGRVNVPLEVALAAGKTSSAPVDLLRHKGWHVVDPNETCADLEAYRNYLQSSKGEWSVAKNGYVKGNVGWFSCRSACYLAAGRPVIVQDTGFSGVLPVGEGLLTFADFDEAVACLEAVEADYETHSATAQDIAAEHFDSDRILRELIERATERSPSGAGQ